MADYVLEVQNIDKVYGQGETEVYALRNLSFKVKRGEFMLIVGSSGSGKSTLLNMIGLLDRPTRGKVIIDGVDTSELSDNQLSAFRNSKLGFIFQFSNLLTDLTVLENVTLPRKIQGTIQNSSDEARTLLKTVGLGTKSGNNKSVDCKTSRSTCRRAYGKLGFSIC